MTSSEACLPALTSAGGETKTGQFGAARIRTLTFSINSIFVWSPQEGEGRERGAV